MIKRKSNAAGIHRRPPTFDTTQQMALADGLVGYGFRCWMTGYLTADVTYWENVWQTYSKYLGTADGRRAVTCLSEWIGAVRSSASREIIVAAQSCPSFCRDECMAVSLVAACQRDSCPAARACAFALLGNSNINTTIEAASDFADALRVSGAAFDVSSVWNAAAVVEPVGGVHH
jgi:hypothetical protein